MRSTSVLLSAALLGAVLSVAIRKPQQLNSWAYDDSFARYKMLSFACSTYATDANLCFKTAYPNGGNNTVTKRIEVGCDASKSVHCNGLTAVTHTDKAIIVVFRGTDQFTQLIQESLKTIIGAEEFIAGGYVSQYFYNAFKSVWHGEGSITGLEEEFLSLRKQFPDYEVWVTGHSLGGAMASLCAATVVHLGQANPQKLKLMTFGQPRVGDQKFADAHDALIPFSYRVVHNLDIVPHVPPEFLPDHSLFDGYRHHKSEVWYPNKMRVDDSYSVCNEDEGNKCSDGSWLPELSVFDHVHYFQSSEMITDFGEDGCPRSMTDK
ncbi:hypothetical protein QR680_005919 [Steinernema hermaphroditum]|uniref:Fungal lipase-type domain-containing protein n=1 Tax=Steinernema hermaphroditum TaxID=289476 RepID=A0AA39HTQ8_9BILA|nr:hypothetical protein QR680_005919 [Steinernema hermaphroditum]